MSGIAVALAFAMLTQEAKQAPSDTGDPVPSKLQTLDTAAKAAFEARLTQVGARLATVKDLRADFVQRKKTSLLKKPIESKGTLTSRGASVLWQTREPRPIGMLVNEAEVKVYYPEDKLVEVYPLGSGFRDATGGPLPRLEQLRERFDVVELDAKELSDSPDRSHLMAIRLTPKSDELKKHIASVRVLIDDSIPCANRVVVVDPDGDEIELRFSNVRINSDVADTEVDLTFPKGVRVSHPISGNEVPDKAPSSSKPPEKDG